MSSHCPYDKTELTALIHEQLPQSEAQKLRAHIEECSECALLFAELSKTQDIISACLADCGTPVDLTEKIISQTRQNRASQRTIIRSITGTKTGSIFNKSPYAAASFLAHIAAIAVIAFLIFSREEKKAGYVSQHNTPVHESIHNKIAMRDEWLQRNNRDFVMAAGVRVDGGVRIGLSGLNVKAKTLTLVDSPELGCIKAFAQAGLAAGTNIKVENSQITIPTQMAELRINDTDSIRIIKMPQHLEIWDRTNWHNLSHQALSYATGMMPLLAKYPSTLKTAITEML